MFSDGVRDHVTLPSTRSGGKIPDGLGSRTVVVDASWSGMPNQVPVNPLENEPVGAHPCEWACAKNSASWTVAHKDPSAQMCVRIIGKQLGGYRAANGLASHAEQRRHVRHEAASNAVPRAGTMSLSSELSGVILVAPELEPASGAVTEYPINSLSDITSCDGISSNGCKRYTLADHNGRASKLTT